MKVLSVAGDRVSILLSGADTNGAYTVMEAHVPRGGGPPPHVHHREDEVFQVLVGEITVFLGDKTILLKAGDSAFAPRDIPHHFKNTGSIDALILEIAIPSGIELFFELAGTPLKDRQEIPVPFSPEDATRLFQIAPDFGIEILVPSSSKN